MTNGHPIREDEFELFALGVIAGEECASIQAHIDACPECARKLAEARGRVALLSLAAPQQNPPAALKQRLLETIRAEKSLRAVPVRGTRPAPRWWNTIWAPAALALAIATVFLWISDRRLDRQLHQMRQATQTYQAQTQRDRELVQILTARDTMTVSLSPMPQVPKAWASLKYNPRMGLVCYTGDLPAPPPNKVYQMWIVPASGAAVSAGVFMPAAFNQGRVCVAKVPRNISCKAFAVTLEPAGGMPQPTGAKVLAGAL
ncbi:MAG TPA: anti-sigma factor [Candidatus Limnocylindrales bacterium]|nr:anti-sigma factor [Candidatus Limnocylindrales bacterium]